jgi:DHA3 family macrolide efflux protein-like MFS transporter
MSPQAPTSPGGSLRTFVTVWFGQLISTVGSGAQSFALGAYIYQASGSVTRFALATFFSSLPMVVLSPFAGVLADRWDRRKLMLLGHLGAGLNVLLIWVLFTGHEAGHWVLRTEYLYVPLFLRSASATVCYPAWSATVPQLVPRRHLGRAAGLAELSAGLAQICGPLIAGALQGAIGLRGILVVDAATFFFAVAVLLAVRFPERPARAAAEGARSFGADLVEGWRFIRERPGLLGLLGFITANGFIVAMVMLLISPLVLAFSDIHALKWIASIAGMGGLAGGITASIWGGPKRRIRGIVGLSMAGALVLLLAALPPSVPLIAGAAAAFLFTFPLLSACNQFIWQTKVPPELQGRVASVRRFLFLGMGLVVALVGGPLVDTVFEPWMAPGGALAASVGRVIGTGPGRGIALMFLLVSLMQLANSLVLWLSPRVRRVEAELPDAVPATPRAPSSTDTAPAAPARLATSGSSES